jgi:bacterioferritin (cytochrome b1)
MVGNPAVIAQLNTLLAGKFAAIHQYAAHYGALANWGYDKLAALVTGKV